jgi:hypothetical protein
LTNYIFEDVRKRIDIGLMWIFNNYLNLKQAYKRKALIENLIDKNLNDVHMLNDDEIVELPESKDKTKRDLKLRKEENILLIKKYEHEYDRTLYAILFSLQNRQEPKDFLFSKIISQVPLLTDNCLKLLKTFCQDESRYYFSMSTLCDLIATRTSQRQLLLSILLEFTHNQNSTFRVNAISLVLKLNQQEEFSPIIKVFI